MNYSFHSPIPEYQRRNIKKSVILFVITRTFNKASNNIVICFWLPISTSCEIIRRYFDEVRDGMQLKDITTVMIIMGMRLKGRLYKYV